MATNPYAAAAYGTVGTYFGLSGAGGSSDPGGSSPSQSSGGDATQGGGQKSGSGWISAAVGFTQSDKSAFTTNLSNWAGGITNNQIIDSPGSTAAASSGASQAASTPFESPQFAGAFANPEQLLMLAFAGMALILWASKGRG